MNTKSGTKSRLFQTAVIFMIAMLLLAAMPGRFASAAPLAAPAVDGDGIMTVSPITVVYGASTTFTFTFTPTAPRDFGVGSSVELTIPAGWTTPVMLTNVTVNAGTCDLNPSWSIVGQVIVIDVNSCLSGQFFTIAYTGTPGPVSGSAYTFTTQTDVPGGNGKFNITAGSPQVTVTKKALTVTGITAADVVYGNGAFGSTLNFASANLNGKVGADDVSLATPLPTTGSFAIPYTVANNKPLTVATLTLTGVDSGNYSLTQPSLTANITPKNLTITGTTGVNKVYDGGTSASVNTTSSALVGNLDGSNNVLVKSGATGVFTLDGNVGTGKTVQASGFTLSGTAAFNYTLSQPTTTANITPKALTVTGITASDKPYDANTSATIDTTAAALSGIEAVDVGSVVLNTALASGVFTPDGNAGVGKTVQISGLTISGSASGNYSLTQPTATATITPKSVTVTPDAGQTKVFGASDPTFTYTHSALIDPDSITGSLNRLTGEDAGTYAFTLGTLTAGGNYSLSIASETFSITPKPITVTADAGQTKVFGASDPVFTYTSSDPATSFTGALDRAAGEDVGNYAIGQGSLSAGTNYSITFVSNDFSITPKPITVTADAGQSKFFGDADPLAFAYTSSDPAATFSGALDRALGEDIGTYAIGQGTLAVVSGNYNMSFISNLFTINVKPITVTADAGQSKVYGDADPVFTYTSSDPAATFTGALDRAAGEDVGNYAIGKGTLDVVGGNYAFTIFVPNDFTVNAKPITVTADAKSKTVGAADPALTYTFVPALVGTDAFSGALARDPGEVPGVYAITQNTLALGGNYAITYVGADLTINPKISGNAGVSGVTLKYNDGGLKSVISGAGGTYSLVVSYGWSGNVTPTKSGYVFTPSFRHYANVTSNQTGQNYVASTQRAKNGGFNAYVGASKIPQYWTAANFAATDGKNTASKKEGTASVKIAGAAGKTKTLTQTLMLKGVSGNKFTFSFWAKGASIPVAGVCRAQVLLYNGATLMTTKTINCASGSYAFQQKKLSFFSTSAYTKVVIKFTYAKSSGSIWFDAVSLMR